MSLALLQVDRSPSLHRRRCHRILSPLQDLCTRRCCTRMATQCSIMTLFITPSLCILRLSLHPQSSTYPYTTTYLPHMSTILPPNMTNFPDHFSPASILLPKNLHLFHLTHLVTSPMVLWVMTHWPLNPLYKTLRLHLRRCIIMYHRTHFRLTTIINMLVVNYLHMSSLFSSRIQRSSPFHLSPHQNTMAYF